MSAPITTFNISIDTMSTTASIATEDIGFIVVIETIAGAITWVIESTGRLAGLLRLTAGPSKVNRRNCIGLAQKSSSILALTLRFGVRSM